MYFFVAFFVMLFTLFALFSTTATAQFNPQINYQAKLADDTGATVATADYDIVFRLYTASSSGTLLWTESRTGGDQVTVTNGLFSVMLGDVNPLTSVDFNQPLYLSVEVQSDGEMSPRKALGAVPAAFEAENAQTLGGIATSSFLRGDIANSASALLSFNSGFISSASSTISELTTGTTTVTTFMIDGEEYTTLSGGSSGLINSGGTLTTNISESNLNIAGLATDNYLLQASSSAIGGFAWVATSSLGFSSQTLTVGDGITLTGDELSVTAAGGLLQTAGGLTTTGILEDFNNLGANTADNEFLVSTGAGILAWENATTARASLGVDAAGTDNSTNVTIVGTPNYITLSGQEITLNVLDVIDDTNLTATGGITLNGSGQLSLTNDFGSAIDIGEVSFDPILEEELTTIGDLETQLGGTDIITSGENNDNDDDLSDNDTDDLAEGSTNQYFTNTRARNAISETITGLTYTAGTGVFSLDGAYTIPLTASTTAWNVFYDTPSDRITAGTGLSWSGNTLNNDVVDTNTQLSQSQVEDFAFLNALSGNTENLITVTYQTGDNTVDFVVNDDLSQYDNTTSGFLTTINNSNWSGADLSIANGGTGASNAGAARTNLGATTVGSNFFTLTDPDAVRFVRINVDNSVSSLDAAAFRTAIGAGTGGGSVNSVSGSGGTTGLTLTGGPITNTGTLTLGGTLGIANGGTGATTAGAARTALGVDAAGTDNSTNVTLAGQNYLSLSGQEITANAIDLSGSNVSGTLAATRFPALTGDITTSVGSLTTAIASGVIVNADINAAAAIAYSKLNLTDSLAFTDLAYTATLANNPSLGANETFFGTTGVIFEGSTANTFEGLLAASNPTADRTWTLPDTTGTIALTSSAMTGTFDGNNFAGGAVATGDLLYGSGAGVIAERAIGTTGQVLQVSGGLPTWVSTSSLGFLTSVNDSNWSGADLSVANGGTGASTESAARTNLGLAIGSNVQAFDAQLADLADGQLSGAGTVADTALSANVSLLGSEIDISGETNLAVGSGITLSGDTLTVTAAGGLAQVAGGLTTTGVLQDLNTLGANTGNNEFLVSTGAGALAWESAATARTSLGVDAAGTDNSTNVTLAGTPNYITLSGQQLTLTVIDINDDTNLSAGTGLSFSGDTLNAEVQSSDLATIGSDNRVPFSNSGGTDFDYSPNFTFDGSQLRTTGGFTDLTPLFLTRGVVTEGIEFNLTSGSYEIAATDKILDLTSSSSAIRLNPGGTQAMQLSTNGNVGIGDTSPASLLTVGSGDAFQVNSSGQVIAGTWNGTAIDVSSYTNLVAGTGLTLAGDTLNVDDDYVLNTGDTIEGALTLDTAGGGNILTLQGDTESLVFSNPTTGDYEIENPGSGNSILFNTGGGDLELKNTNTTRLAVTLSGVDVTGDLAVTGDLVVTGTVDGKDIATNAGMLNEAEVITANWVNTANPWDISSETNLAVGSGITLTGDTLTVTAAGGLAQVAGGLTTTGVLQDLNTLGANTGNNEFLVSTGAGALAWESAATARTSLGVDAAGTDNSTNVTLAGTPNYITLSGQQLTLTVIDINDDTNLSAGTGLSFSGDTLNAEVQSSDLATIGSDNRVPFSNSGGTDFDYSPNFTFDGSQLRTTGGFTDLTPLFLTRGVVTEGIEFNLTSGSYEIAATDKLLELTSNSNGIVFNAANSEAMRISTVGNVGIGTTSPASKLDVWGDLRAGTSGNPTFFVDASADQLIIGGTSVAGAPDGNQFLTIMQDSDDRGIEIVGFDDRSTRSGRLNVDANGHLSIESTAATQFRVDNKLLLTLNNTEHVVVNENSDGAVTFRVESDNDQNLINTDAVNDRVGIGVAAPLTKLDVNGDLLVRGDEIFFQTALTAGDYLSYATQDGITYHENGSANWRLSSAARQSYVLGDMSIGISTNPGDARLTVQTSGTADILNLFEAGGNEVFTVLENGNVGIGTSTPVGLLDLYAASGYTYASVMSGNGQGALHLFNNEPTPAADTRLGNVNFGGQNSSGVETQYARILGYVTDDTAGSEDGYLSFETTRAGAIATEAMRINNFGNVGIGGGNPSSILDISQDGATFTITDTDTALSDNELSGRIDFVQSDASGAGVSAQIVAIGNGSSGQTDLGFFTGGNGSVAQRFTINNAGRVGIGITDPEALFHIRGNNNGSTLNNELRITDLDGGADATTQLTGKISFETRDANSPGINAYIEAQNTQLTQGSLAFGTGLGGSAVDRMTIDHTGKVGIGTTAPGSILDIVSGASVLGPRIINSSENTGEDGGSLATAGTDIKSIGFHDEVGDYTFAKITTRNYNIDGTGWFGITSRYDAGIDFDVSLNGTLSRALSIQHNGVVVPGADDTQNLGSPSLAWSCLYYDSTNLGTCTSDASLKSNVQDLTFGGNPLEQIQGMRLRSYEWNEDLGDISYGVVAQELLETSPELVELNEDGLYEVNYGLFSYLNIAATQQFKYDLDELLLTGSTSASSSFAYLLEPESDSVWKKMSDLVAGFVDGVLSVTGLRTDELCVGDVCVTEAEFAEVFGAQAAARSTSGTGNTSGATTNANPSSQPTTAPTEPIAPTASTTSTTTPSGTTSTTTVPTTDPVITTASSTDSATPNDSVDPVKDTDQPTGPAASNPTPPPDNQSPSSPVDTTETIPPTSSSTPAQ